MREMIVTLPTVQGCIDKKSHGGGGGAIFRGCDLKRQIRLSLHFTYLL